MSAVELNKLPPGMPDHTLRVLVVEDDLDSACSAARLLEVAGYEVKTARNGTEGMVVAKGFLPHVVLLDIGLPGLNGFQVARELRKSRPDLLLIAITGRCGPEVTHCSLEAGFNHLMVKPVDFSRMIAFIADMRPRRAQLDCS